MTSADSPTGTVDMTQPVSTADVFSSLSEAEAQARLVAEGYNELPRSSQRRPLCIAFEREPMLALLKDTPERTVSVLAR